MSKVLSILERTEARNYCQGLAAEHKDSAMRRLSALNLAEDMDSQLRGLAKFFLEREH